MKRPRQDDSPDSPEYQSAIAAAFKPDQKRKAGDICKKGTDGTGYIEGKVYERGTISGDTWEFVLTVELGSRAHVLLSGNISKCFQDLPIAVGAQVRISARGLVLEEILADKPKPLHLHKRFVWRDGATIHVRSKTGQEAFFDIWEDTTSSNATSNRYGTLESAPRAAPIPSKRRRTTTSPVSGSSHVANLAVNGSNVNVVYDAPPSIGVVQTKPDDAVHMDPSASVDVVVSTPVLSTEDGTKSQQSSNDSQNPQSLPSPPPEDPTAREPGEGAPSDEPPTGQPSCPPISRNSRNQSTSSRPGSRQQIRTTVTPVPDESPALPTAEHHRNAEAGPSRPAPGPPLRPSNTLRSKLRRQDKDKEKRKRKLKQLGKAGKLQPQPLVEAAGSNSDEEYWAGGDEIPDHLLVAAAEQGEMGKAWSDRGSATPVPEPPQRPPSPARRSTIPTALVPPLAPSIPPRSPSTAILDHVSPARAQPSVSSPRRPSSSQEERIDPVESLKQGCPASIGTYTPLIDFRGAGTKHVMGVVSSGCAIQMTKTGEFVVRFDLFDPTNIASSGLNVCLFEKTRRALPEPAAGDIVLLRSIAGDKFNEYMCPVGPSFKGWQWAIFPAKTAMFSLAPSESSLRHFKPETVEVQYTIRLSDWWKDISASTVSFGDDAPVVPRGSRTHQLLSEVGEVGFFDCTVEILHGYSSGNNTYTVFVTDYTQNPGVAPVQATWCPPKLAEVAVQVELWDSSSMVGPTMQVGEYYSIRNMRMKRSGGGYLEGRMQEGNKIQKLDEDELESQPHLVELLKRKKEWETNAKISGGVTEFPHQLIEEVEENRHFNCTVEVVSISSKDDYSYLYVTDYTARTDLVPVSPAIASGDLAERVVRVSLNDAQVELGRALDAGDYIAIRNLRLRPAGSGSLLCGRLGGEQRLITKLNPRATGNKELKALLRRKEDFEAAQNNNSKPGKRGASVRAARQAEAAVAKGRKAETSRPSRKGKERATDDCVSLADVKASEECPGVFRVRVRVVDFFPDDLRDCTYLRCTNCDAILPKMHRMCTKCDDVMDTQTFVQAFFELYFRLADEDGTTLEVSVADERCSILQDMEPQDVHEDVDGAFDMFVSRVRPLLGDLLNTSDGEARRDSNLEDETCGPVLNLTLGSWLPEGEPDSADSRAYIVLHHSILESDA